MKMKVEIVSREIIKPSSPTPNHLKYFKTSMLDQLVPPVYVPLVLFYTGSNVSSFSIKHSNSLAIDTLKNSLSQILTRFYPLAGRMRSGNAFVECNDEGVLFMEAESNIELSVILEDPEDNVLQQFLPFDPFNLKSDTESPVMTGVQVNVFKCGGIAIGVCVSHKIADGNTAALFLNAWATTATGVDRELLVSRLDLTSSLFPPRTMNQPTASGSVKKEKIATKRFIFNAQKLADLRAKVASCNYNEKPTSIESVTALIWKSALEAAKLNSGNETFPESIATHVVNIRDRMVPPLPEKAFGNLWQFAAATFKEEVNEVELKCLAGLIRKSIRKIDSNYVNELQGVDGLAKACQPYKELRSLASKQQSHWYVFSSWIRFPFYETDFGWGKPTWVCTTGLPRKNVIILMGTPSGDGIEAWITLTENDMVELESNKDLCHFVSTAY